MNFVNETDVRRSGRIMRSRASYCGFRYRPYDCRMRRQPICPPNILPTLPITCNVPLRTRLEVNPVGTLQNLCFMRKWSLPEWEFYGDQTFGCLHTAFCMVGVFVERGVGLTKQKAKNQAARAIYDRIWLRTEVDTLEPVFHGPAVTPSITQGDQRTEATLHAPAVMPSITHGDQRTEATLHAPAVTPTNQGTGTQAPLSASFELAPKAYVDSNPIGTLQELCMKRRWHLPAYAEYKANGVYTVTCRVGTYEEKCSGVISKLAKKQSARLVYERVKHLKSYLSEPSPGFEKFESPGEPVARTNPTPSGVDFGTPGTVTEFMTRSLVNQLRSSDKPCVNRIKTSTNVEGTFAVPSQVVIRLGMEEGIDVMLEYTENTVVGMTAKVVINGFVIFEDSSWDPYGALEKASLKCLTFLNRALN